jgi:hypothetical protein
MGCEPVSRSVEIDKQESNEDIRFKGPGMQEKSPRRVEFSTGNPSKSSAVKTLHNFRTEVHTMVCTGMKKRS